MQALPHLDCWKKGIPDFRYRKRRKFDLSNEGRHKAQRLQGHTKLR